MNLHFTNSFIRKVKRLTKKDPSLKRFLKKQFKIFAQDPYHPSLKTHKLKGKRINEYSILIKSNLRAIAVKEKDNFIFFDLITHDEY